VIYLLTGKCNQCNVLSGRLQQVSTMRFKWLLCIELWYRNRI